MLTKILLLKNYFIAKKLLKNGKYNTFLYFIGEKFSIGSAGS